jgi:hypothetical protein
MGLLTFGSSGSSRGKTEAGPVAIIVMTIPA